MSKTAIFLYGTLKRGGRSNHLLAGQEFAAEAETLPLYRLYDHGAHPCLVDDRNHGVAVRGEVWHVDEATLTQLDTYEEAPTYFRRGEIQLRNFPPPVTAYFYQGDVAQLEQCGPEWPLTDY
jgi:gamma-glutamylaminecyclotransferase